MKLEKLTIEELLKNYERLSKRSRHYLTARDAKYKEKVRKELLKRLG